MASASPAVNSLHNSYLGNCSSVSCNGTPVGNPYIDPAQLNLQTPQISFYVQPWRGYMQAVPATQFLNGIGVNYNPHNETPAQDNANLQYLASIGIHSVRLEVPWDAVDPNNETQLRPGAQAELNGILAACKQYGITPTILLNANDGGPEPLYPTYSAQVLGTAAAGSKQITISGVPASAITVHVDGTSNGSSGLSLASGNGSSPQAANLITNVTTNADGTLTLDLSQPTTMDATGNITIYYLKYLPLYPVGTAEFNNTMTGWMQYVQTVNNAVNAAGITNYSVEIWNELSFGSEFLDIRNYTAQNLPIDPTDFHSGGRAWELANQTTTYLKNTYGSNIKVIWGFSNTANYMTSSSKLPGGTDGESYHPYWTSPITAQALIDDSQNSIQNLVGGSYVPNTTVALPEGAMGALPISKFQLIQGKLAPNAYDPAPSPDFKHYMTENGVQPKDLYPNGISDSTNQQLKAKALLRNYSFWLNKGVSQLDWYCAFDDTSLYDRGFNILAKNADVGASPVTAQSQSLQNFTNQFAGATQITSPRTPSVTVKDITPSDDTSSYQVFPASPDGTEPALNYREMFQFLPFQVTDNKFVFSTYVMGWNLTQPPPKMDFQLDIHNVKGTGATISYYDPITNTTAPVNIISTTATDTVVNVEAADYPRLLIVQEN